MASKTLLDELELPLAQCIDVEDSQALVRHAVPGLDGDLLQRMGRRAARVAVTGVVTGPEARDGLEQLRDKLRQTEPVDFVADIATATRVSRVLVEELDVRELAGKPERFEYAFLLREFNPPPEPETPPPGENEGGGGGVDDGVVPETGTLEVEVVVEGEPGFDMGRVTVTAEGPLGAPSSSVHALPDREGNLWTLSGLAEGSYTVRGTVAQPVMADAETAAIEIGRTTRVQLRLVRAAGVARAFTLSFRFNSAFVEPCMREVLRRAAEYSDAHPSENLVVVGHTDKVDDEPYNQSLSERRARTVFSSLDFVTDPQRAVDEWTAIRQRRTVRHRTEKDTWAIREYQQMLQELGYYPGRIDGIHGPITNEAVRGFRCDHELPPGTTVDDDVWRALILEYLADDAPAVPRDRFLPNCADSILEWLGCGEEDPVLPVDRAHRPNRRTELLFVTDTALPCEVRVPDTWHLPPPGRTPAQWCVGDPASSRTCFISRDTSAPPAWTVEHADSAQINVTVRIQREVEQPDGTTVLTPGGVTRFVLITGEGAFKRDELGSGEPREAETLADGTFVVPETHRAGVFVLEVREGVLARLEEEADASSTGPGVCKTLLVDGEISVVILRDPVLREIRLPVIAHLMTALHPDTREVRTCPDPANPATPRPQRTSADQAAVEALLARANQVWRRGRIRFELDHVVRETFATAGVTECHVTADEADPMASLATTPNLVNLFLFGSTETTGDAGRTVAAQVVNAADEPLFQVDAVAAGDRVAVHPSMGAPTMERAPDADEQGVILAHHLGHYLELQDAGSASRRQLMFSPESTANRRLLADEVDQARAAHNARGNCGRIFMNVQGAHSFGGVPGHRFVAIRDAAADPVVVDALLPQGVTPGPGFSMRGGVEGAASTQRLVTRADAGRTEVVARLAQSGGARAIESWAFIYVVDFELAVPGGILLPGSTPPTFVVPTSADALIVQALVSPDPIVVPDDLVAWEGGEAMDDPLRRRVPRDDPGDTEVSATVAGVTRTVRIVAVRVRLDVDADRDGTVEADEGDRNTWDFGVGQRGAVILCNLDDDDSSGTEDNRNTVVDGAADAQDLAPLVVRACGTLPAGVSLVLVPDPRDRVRIFAARAAGAAAVAGPGPLPAEHVVTNAATQDVELGMEGVTYPEPGFDGEIRIALVLRQGTTEILRDDVKVRVAPWIMPSHLDVTQEVYVMEGAFNAAFLVDLEQATQAASVPLRRTNVGGYLEAGRIDQWVQDTVEIGVSTMPGRSLSVALDAVRTRGLNPYARNELFGPDYGFLRVSTTTGENTFDSHGNLEVSPPVTVGGREFKLGRIYFGGGRPAIGSFPVEPFNPDFLAFLRAQAVQSPFAIDTSWLAVGHVDEFLSFVPATSGKPFRLVVADTPSCVQLLRGLSTAGNGGLTLFTGKTTSPFEERTVDELLADTALLDDNRLIVQRKIENVLSVLVIQLGLDPVADVLRIPSLFEESRWSPRRNDATLPPDFEALIPGMVNLLCLTGTTFAGHHLAMARPFGPVLGGADQVEAEVVRRFGTIGYQPSQIHFVDDFDSYHVAAGEVHCGTNSRRRAPATPWWEQTEF
ncbi:MAG TPA: protein-arginine deiminase family protein [Longimicrobium sp.]|nr:protein-arginine deiminase family protein [Longimicrobium sp.]